MRRYSVTFTVEVRAEGVLEAAEAAFSILRDTKNGSVEAEIVDLDTQMAAPVIIDVGKRTGRMG